MKVHVKNRQCFSIILVFMLSFGLIDVYAQTSHTEAAVTISQSTLPTITFSNMTVNVILDDSGVGYFELALLRDGAVILENLGSNVVEFQLDPDGPYAANNADGSGVYSNNAFPLQDFETANLTVQFNGTHFRINHSDNTFAGTTPHVTFEASIHPATGNDPAIHEDLGGLMFNITVDPICQYTVNPRDATFGTVNVGNTSDDIAISVVNSGNMPIVVDVGADHWCDATTSGCITGNTVNPAVMQPGTTHFTTSDVTTAYASKTAFTDFDYDTTNSPPTRGTTEAQFLTPNLFTLVANGADIVYFQVQVDLIPEASMFAGAVSQEIILSSECPSP